MDPSETRVPRRLWGVRRWKVMGPHGRLEADLVFVPTGLLVVGRCQECGGRAEHLAELDSGGVPAPTNVDGASLGKREPFEAPKAGLKQVFAKLTKQHQKCAQSPRSHTPKQLAAHLLDRTLADARHSLASEGAAAGRLYLLMNDGRACAMVLDQLVREAPAPSVERTANRAGGVEAIRQYLRALNLRPSAAVIVTEAWASPLEGYEQRRPGEGPREEMVIASLVTPTFGRVGWAEITRPSGEPEVGPRAFSELAWKPLTESAPLTDGIFATSDTRAGL